MRVGPETREINEGVETVSGVLVISVSGVLRPRYPLSVKPGGQADLGLLVVGQISRRIHPQLGRILGLAFIVELMIAIQDPLHELLGSCF